MTGFRAEQIDLLAGSGWADCPSVAALVASAGLPQLSRAYLESTFTTPQWDAAEAAVTALRVHFAAARFAEEVEYGVLLVPDPAKLDTRAPQPAEARKDQLGEAAADVVDSRLPAGTLGIPPGTDWSMVAAVTGPYGLAMGSHQRVVEGPEEAFTVLGTDTRLGMLRQFWGARVLQAGHQPPDCEANDHWTFTLFPGEPLTDGSAESGTVLKGKVRFRLGKPDRGIGPARVAPAIVVQ
ncbi:hypothetical protein [Pseudonocardia spinosispora]|uniref:hypothetical protein n=1 Tax=Pseudonocardia spinosispora TaxID=103441 RepID=UPI0004134072|nr:hypothetical protein [Pseudonocardia spinosispora]